jgi:uronate dehydrogenase
MADASSRRIVFTGASGGIGTMIRPLLAPLYPGLVLSDKVAPKNLLPGEKFVAADLTKPDEVAAAVKGADSVIHLGGYSVEGPWDTILQANIIGCYNLFEAARQAGVKRVVFASSNHAVGFYPRKRKIGTDVTVRPDSRYGVSKAFGEALGRFYADKFGLGVMCIRIGNFADRPADRRRLSIWISPRDFRQLVRIGLEHPDLHFETVYGASESDRSWWDNANAYRLGYRPEDESEPFAADVLAAEPEPTGLVAERFQGGPFCSAEFAGDPARIE